MKFKYWIPTSVCLFLFIVDRFVKSYFLRNPRVSGDFIHGIIEFRFMKNYGIAFGFPYTSQMQFMQPVLIVIIFIFIFILMHYLMQAFYSQKKYFVFSLMLIIGGALSNLLDRIYIGSVIDYIDVPFFTVFNIADIMITLGVLILLIQEILIKKRKENIHTKI